MSEAVLGVPQAGRAPAEETRMRRRAIVSCAIGNFVELFDFLIYGLFAAQIGANFFPSGNSALELLKAFAIYGVGFLMRPVGAIVIGAYGDLKGRKSALVLTVGLMATATALTGLVPSYATIGIWGPIGLVLCRLVQGFSTGGEWGGAAAFMVEYAPPGKRGLIGSMQQFSVGLALIAGTLSAALLNSTLDKQAMIEWGWRVPFIAGFVLAPVGLYLRTRVLETPAYDRTVARHEVARNPFLESVQVYWRPVLAAFGLSVIGTVGNYVYNIFLPTFASTQLKVAASTAYQSTTIAAVILTLMTPFMGWLSDRVGRKPFLLVCSFGYAIVSYPLFVYLVGSPGGTSLMITQLVSALFLSMYGGVICAVLSELFPTKVRFTALSIGYGMAVTIFGGFAPMVSGYLISATGNPVSPAFYVIFGALISGITVSFMKDRTNAPLD